MSVIYATPAFTNPFVVRRPTPADDAVRIVRWGLADVLLWLGEQPGPWPGDPWCTTTHYDAIQGRRMIP